MFFGKGKRFLLFSCFTLVIWVLISNLCFATIKIVDIKKYVSPDENFANTLIYLLDPEKVQYHGDINPYKVDRNKILLLGDGYERVYTQLSTQIEKIVLPKTVIYKADIMAPTNPMTKGNIVYQKLDHQQIFPFRDNSFDLIVGRRILCNCSGVQRGCGGLSTISPELMHQFLGEVVRVLDKSDPNAFALLHGFHFGTYPVVEDNVVRVWSQLIPQVVRYFEEVKGIKVDIKMLYLVDPNIDEEIKRDTYHRYNSLELNSSGSSSPTSSSVNTESNYVSSTAASSLMMDQISQNTRLRQVMGMDPSVYIFSGIIISILPSEPSIERTLRELPSEIRGKAARILLEE